MARRIEGKDYSAMNEIRKILDYPYWFHKHKVDDLFVSAVPDFIARDESAKILYQQKTYIEKLERNNTTKQKESPYLQHQQESLHFERPDDLVKQAAWERARGADNMFNSESFQGSDDPNVAKPVVRNANKVPVLEEGYESPIDLRRESSDHDLDNAKFTESPEHIVNRVTADIIKRMKE